MEVYYYNECSIFIDKLYNNYNYALTSPKFIFKSVFSCMYVTTKTKNVMQLKFTNFNL